MDSKNTTKQVYSTPQFERFGNVRDLTLQAGKNNPAGIDAGTNAKSLANFVRTH